MKPTHFRRPFRPVTRGLVVCQEGTVARDTLAEDDDAPTCLDCIELLTRMTEFQLDTLVRAKVAADLLRRGSEL